MEEVDLQTRTINISYINYFLVSTAKLSSLYYYRTNINEIFKEFRQTYPTEECEKAFHLQKYLNQYLKIEKVLAGFFKTIFSFYTSFPFVLSVLELIKNGRFGFITPCMLWYGIESPKDNYFLYVLYYFSQSHASCVAATTILGLDLCLFSSLLQLCMHFDIVSKNILLIEPDEKATVKLKEQIVYHQRLLRLAEKLNVVFTPSVLFSLLSSSLIICFAGFQLLGDLSLFIITKSVILLAYELKQVAITCFLGDKLIEISQQISNSMYAHKWYLGTPKYREIVLMVLMRSQKSVGLRIGGISDISLQTFRNVMSISYQVFTLLKAG
ncbi:putative odorant receptor 92a [Episyrphus balteatus]|uniref:putative odorant receptor 92a n=1 Tax=Episyrphus balteatus TaxID=286459 RepID=UPI002486C53D|nr:putative odorant receptor 92a [Episyrphus balteatus]